MKKILLIIPLLILTGCAETLAFLGPMTTGATSGTVARSSINAVTSYGIKKQTGKTPIQHAYNYAKKNNQKKINIKKQPITSKNCDEYLEPMSPASCSVIRDKISKLSKINSLN
jgi:hypothetical protein|tara:strand:+ start:1162 stop:1503 length:342 start_codon:yes stop_codon:yes gene_type:complete